MDFGYGGVLARQLLVSVVLQYLDTCSMPSLMLYSSFLIDSSMYVKYSWLVCFILYI
jgi:hypothetical protein